MGYLIDTNVIANFTSVKFSEKAMNFLAEVIVDECIVIRRNIRMKTPDAIIAATAIVNDFILLTSDTDFNRIPNLRILNPFYL